MKTLEKAKQERGESGAKTKGDRLPALSIDAVGINEHCTGSRWAAADADHLARIIAIVAMGQAAHAARIIAELLPSEPAVDDNALRIDAKRRLSVRGKTDQKREASRYHRDGLIFETISWIAAQQSTTGKALIRDPHLSSTSQGLDGLMIELDESGAAIAHTTIFEDKCSEHPRDKFRDEIMPAFKAHHENRRASELVSTAAALIGKIGLDGTAATKAAARVLDRTCRIYRGGLAVTTEYDTQARRKSLFKNYEGLQGIKPDQRIGATLITSDDLRGWFDELANRAIAYIDSAEIGED